MGTFLRVKLLKLENMIKLGKKWNYWKSVKANKRASPVEEAFKLSVSQ